MNSLKPEYLTTQELAELLRIKERKVYELVSSGQVPCTRATGKLLFSRREIDNWLGEKRSEQHATVPSQPRPGVFLGSHDPLLEWAIKESGCGLASNFNGSLDGVQGFQSARGIASAMHLYDAENDDWNVSFVKQSAGRKDAVLIEFCWRERGLVIGSRMQGRVAAISDLGGCKIAPRQASAGSQVLLLKILQQHGMSPDDVCFTDIAYTETDAVTSVFDGSADATLGLRAVARRFNLDFVPLMRERFDILVDRRSWFEPEFQAFLSFCGSKPFCERADSLSGYDVTGFGTVHFNA